MQERRVASRSRRRTSVALVCAALHVAVATSAMAQTPGTRRADRMVDSLLARMTLDEKVGQLNMTPADWNQTGPHAPAGGEQQVREGKIGSFLGFWGAAPTRDMQRIAVEGSRLHIPLLFAQDVIHGWRTVFPVSLAEAASFDTAAVRSAAHVATIESSAYGIHWTFAPMMDIARDPRWGRIVEGAGEDPLLGRAMAAARVRGFQGDLGWRHIEDGDSVPTRMLATAKHFAAYGAAEGGRDYNTADVSERALWEVYLPPFEAAVQAGVGTVMASFNDIGSTPVHASRWLLDDVLRRRWGYDGLVVSDWAGIEQLMPHGVAATPEEAAVLAIRAGVDVDMSDAVYSKNLANAVRKGLVPIALVDASVRRVLRAKQALGLFEDPYRFSDTTRQRLATLTPANRTAARDLARKAIVLLKNESVAGAPVLPLSRSLRSVAVIGALADDSAAVLGSWNGAGRPRDAVTVLAGLRAALPQARVTYERGVPVESLDTRGIAAAVQAARDADAVILVLGEHADLTGEASSRASIELPGAQLELAKAVVRATRELDPRKPVVAVLMNGRPLAVQWLADSVPAIVESWLLGVEHGNALADVLLGDANPSGRLPVTMPRATGQVPIHYAHRNTGRPADAANHYTSKYLDLPWTPLYPFGYGLSYTTFRYGNLRLSAPSARAGQTLRVSADVTNAGSRAGDEVVQLYLRDDVASVAQPVRKLVGFRRLTLRPGETRTVEFTLRPSDLSLYRLDMQRVVEPGTFTLWAGGSSDATLSATYRVVGDTLVVERAPVRLR
ncbi:MAG TPA: beta-glucosidase BglX [Gemmatimonadaceae bacterium]|nr:beta-glucosidase BglX [Gemmatimonadaceae bacterium]